MARYVLPGLESMSEFVGLPTHLFGDCGPDATLMMLHAVAAGPYPLSPYGLGAIDAWEQAHGWAAANGAQNINSMDQALHALGIAHTTIGYSDFTLDGLHTALKDGYSPDKLTAFIIETSTAGLGLPDDERGVQFHFFGVGGMDTTAITPDGKIGGYLRVDGDSRTDSQSGGLTPPILTSWEEIAASGPIASISISMKVSTPVWTIERNAGGTITGAKDDKGHTVGAGFAALLVADNLTAVDGLMSEQYYDATHSVCGLANDAILLYTLNVGQVSGAHGGEFAAEVLGLLNTAQEAIKSLQAQLAAAQAEEGTEAAVSARDAALAQAIRTALTNDGFTHS